MKQLLILLAVLILQGCATTADQFKSFTAKPGCQVYSYATMAVPVKVDGSGDYSYASVGCNNSESYSAKEVVEKCERESGRKCAVVMAYNRYSDTFQNFESKNIANAKNQKDQEFVENLRYRCDVFGYQRGTQQHSDCMLKLNQQTVQSAQQQQALKLQQDAINLQNQDRAMQLMQKLNPPPPPPARSINCQSNRLGDTINTNCW